MKSALLIPAIVVACLAASLVSRAADTPNIPTVRIGVFDSRAVAMAYHRSAAQEAARADRHTAYEKAKKEGDRAAVKEWEREGPWTQVRMHLQVFSTATTHEILASVHDRLPAIAENARVTAIVSKWEIPYIDGTVELIDVTAEVADLFNPSAETRKFIEQMKGSEPVPFSKMSLDPRA